MSESLLPQVRVLRLGLPRRYVERMPEAREQLVRDRLSRTGAYPDEFVVLLGARVVFHSHDREEAVARYRTLSAEAGEAELPALVDPGKRSFRPDPVSRGRSASSTTR